MSEELMNFSMPRENSSIIKIIGVGGAGSNAVNYMFNQGIKDVNFIVCNTDAQALAQSPVPVKIQLGASLTEGRGAGNKPEQGKQAAIENLNDVMEALGNTTKMVFITAGMGGGTGTGAAPIIAQATKDKGILTVGIVTLPFRFEGKLRFNHALEGIEQLKKHVDSLLVINNEKLREMHGDLKLSNAFSKADNILATAAKGIAEIITLHGYINVDFADVQTVMTNSGVAIMGAATAEGEDRALHAIREALTSPLLNNNDIRGAVNVLLNITSGEDEITMDEVGIITDFVQDAVGRDTNIIWGTGTDLSYGKKISVTVIATGFTTNCIPEMIIHNESKKQKNSNENKQQRKIEWNLNENQKIKSSITDETPNIKIVETNENEVSSANLHDILNSSTEKNDNESDKDDLHQDIRSNYEKLRQLSFTYKNKDISELENQPAYERLKKTENNEDKNDEKDIPKYSRFTLSTDGDTPILRENNSYLHDNVD